VPVAVLARVAVADPILLGVTAVAAGTLTPAPLAAAVLTALAAFEAVAPLPGAAISLGPLITILSNRWESAGSHRRGPPG
jgi:ABC-type transport system involved in cytochrome bd biosynthesis fused ATPase/permease subunit